MYSFTYSQKGKAKLTHDGYVYLHDRSRGNTHYFRCERHKGGCPGRAVLRQCANYNDLGGTVEVSGHNHPREEHREGILNAMGLLREQATTSNEAPSAVVQVQRAKLPIEAAPQLPSEDALKQKVRRARKKQFPTEPLRRTGIRLPPALQRTSDGQEDFLLIDTQNEGDDDDDRVDEEEDDTRCLAFATINCLKKLSESSIWLLDGTFKVCPRLFSQVYTIHCMINGEWGLLPAKTGEVYENFLEEVKAAAEENDLTLQPEHIILDFEIAMMNALRRQFPNAQTHGCLFHLAQSVHRRVQSSGLRNEYQQNGEFQLAVRKLTALAFLPPEEIPEAFQSCKDTAPRTSEAIYTYFEETYVLGRPIARARGKGRPPRHPRRHPPRFPPSFWSVHQLQLDSHPRTNNFVESFHRRFEVVVGRHHLGVYPFIRELQKEHHRTAMELERRSTRQAKPRIPRETAEKERRILTLMTNRETMELHQFLRGIAYNMSKEQHDDDSEDEEEEETAEADDHFDNVLL